MVKSRCLFFLFLSCSSYAQSQDSTQRILQKIQDPLVMNNGTPVSTKEQWKNKRRPELLKFLHKEVYGHMPGVPNNIEFQVVEKDSLALGGFATREQISISITVGGNQQKIGLLVYSPNQSLKPSPVFLALNFAGNHTIAKDPAIRITQSWVKNKSYGVKDNYATAISRGSASKDWPLRKILENGYALATIYAGDIAPDFKGGRKLGIQSLYPELQNRGDNFSTMAAWAWGLSRAMDYIETDANLDPNKVIVFGTSRLGKAALWAGATDDRFAITISNQSGAGGAKLYHHHFQEDIAQIERVFPYWFCRNFKKYAEKDMIMKYDQHLMMSLIAPRPLLITSGKKAAVCDPYGEFLGALATSPVYEFLGKEPLPVKTFPKVDEPAFGTIGYYLRHGKHGIKLYDWERFIEFANMQFKL